MSIYKFAVCAAVVLLAGCSSIVDGSSQEITINTNPAGAVCSLERHGEQLGTTGPTPSTIKIDKTKYDITIKCTKDSFEEATYLNKSGADGATFGNIVLGGGIGWAVDSATGSDNKYDSPVNLTMVPKLVANNVQSQPAAYVAPQAVSQPVSQTVPSNQ
jgi:hypothetical protein